MESFARNVNRKGIFLENALIKIKVSCWERKSWMF